MMSALFSGRTVRIFLRRILFILPLLILSGCEKRGDLSAGVYEVEENGRDNKAVYPYVVHTESSTWYLAKDDIDLLGEEAYFAGLRETLENMEEDFAEARDALDGYIWEDVPQVDIYTDFCGKASISETAGAYYHSISNFIKVFSGWDMAREALLHEYVHFLTMHCADRPVTDGFWGESIAEYISKIVCKNRMLRSINMGLNDEEASFYKEHGAWDEEEGCIDPRLFYYGTARVIAQGSLVGMEYFSVSDVYIIRTPRIQENPAMETISHIEGASIIDYLGQTFSRDLVFASWDTTPEDMEQVFKKPFPEIYTDWAAWNSEQCEKLGLD